MISHRHESTAGLVIQWPYEAIVHPGPLLDIPIQPDPADGQMRHRNGKRRLADKLRDPGVAEVKHAADLRPGHHHRLHVRTIGRVALSVPARSRLAAAFGVSPVLVDQATIDSHLDMTVDGDTWPAVRSQFAGLVLDDYVATESAAPEAAVRAHPAGRRQQINHADGQRR
jgi:hypothetical protein